MTPSRRTARALDALQRGWPVAIAGDGGTLVVVAVETSAERPDGTVSLLISEARAATLKLANQRAAASPDAPVCIAARADLTPAEAMAVADPARDLEFPLKGPFRAEELNAPDAARAAMHLARIAGLLPAFYILSEAPEGADRIEADDVAEFDSPARLAIAARARLPVAASEAGEIIAFRAMDDAREHVALVIGNRAGTPPLVRVHSECLTGDIFGSLKCDCGPQLAGALAAMAAGDWGVLLYLRQEGRGIGLVNKLRAYQLQDQGFDTVDANNRLGLPTDARDFGLAARMLALLGVPRIRLLTNNPDKVSSLGEHGVEVVERIPLAIEPNRFNARYLTTKRDRTGHAL